MHYIHELGQSCLNIFNPSEGPKILYNALSFLVHSLLFSFILNSIYLLFFPLPFHLLHPSLKTWKKEENKVFFVAIKHAKKKHFGIEATCHKSAVLHSG
jgi:hypothetical protein